jgi:hypothetical protein
LRVAWGREEPAGCGKGRAPAGLRQRTVVED